MNVLQALAVAAAALAISGDPWGGSFARTEAQLTAFAAHAEMLVSELTTDATEHVEENPCGGADHSDGDWAKAKRDLPDTSIHLASRAARL